MEFGFNLTEMPAEENALATTSFKAWCRCLLTDIIIITSHNCGLWRQSVATATCRALETETTVR